ncbi:MAG: hypothetical protein DRP61_06140, partial [Candidatus Omnitrophota bacterium]
EQIVSSSWSVVNNQMEEGEIQRQTEEEERKREEEGETLQLKKMQGNIPEVTPDIESRIRALRGSEQPLPKSIRAFFESRFGYDFSHVRIHTDPEAAKLARALNAEAFTYGRDIYFGEGKYNPGTLTGKRLLAHELTHVVQQRQWSYAIKGEIGERGNACGRKVDSNTEAIIGMNSSKNLKLPSPRREYKLSIRLQPFRDCNRTITGVADANRRIDVARRMAMVIVNHALRALRTVAAGTASTAVTAALTRHFGTPNAGQIRTIISRYEFIQRRLPMDRWYICNTPHACRTGEDAYAWCPGGPYIHICPSFFTPGTNRPATLIHEAAHIAGACDDVYVGDAGYPPTNAQNNADSYAFFAWDIRARPALGPPTRERPEFPSLIEEIIRVGPRVRERLIEEVP